jgi:hypothetical protein
MQTVHVAADYCLLPVLGERYARPSDTQLPLELHLRLCWNNCQILGMSSVVPSPIVSVSVFGKDGASLLRHQSRRRGLFCDTHVS